MSEVAEYVEVHRHPKPTSFIWKYVFSLDHKVIGIQYLALALVAAVRGPSVFDRLLAINLFGTKTVLMIAVLGFLAGRPEFLDIALVYALINFVTTIAVLKVFKFGDLGGTHDAKQDSGP